MAISGCQGVSIGVMKQTCKHVENESLGIATRKESFILFTEVDFMLQPFRFLVLYPPQPSLSLQPSRPVPSTRFSKALAPEITQYYPRSIPSVCQQVKTPSHHIRLHSGEFHHSKVLSSVYLSSSDKGKLNGGQMYNYFSQYSF